MAPISLHSDIGSQEEIIQEKELRERIREKIDLLTKPVGSLGRLEDLALQISVIRQSLSPKMSLPSLVVFVGDHGIASEGVSAYPQEVTSQMVKNYLEGGAAVNVFSRCFDLNLIVIDAGVNFDFSKEKSFHLADRPEKKISFQSCCVRKGSRNFLYEDALTAEELDICFSKAEEIIEDLFLKGCNTIAFGEMGIGNSSSASLLHHLLTGESIENCVGLGSGLDSKGRNHKLSILKKATFRIQENLGINKDNRFSFQNISSEEKYPVQPTPPELIKKILCSCAGYETSMIVGAILAAAKRRMVIVIDGYICTSSLLAAYCLVPKVLDYCVFSHLSGERGHQSALQYLGKKPFLNLEMRLGEGTGAALMFPLLRLAEAFLNEMASFEKAGVSQSIEGRDRKKSLAK